MKLKTECVAMLLAGGVGTRLGALTKKVAKPAVAFGGKYRIIDFPLSNCVNSGIDTVGVLTQYQPLELNDYIGSGQPWDLDRLFGGVHILPPYQGTESADWYKGTANAIYQNLAFIERYDPKYVLILSGDHIYKMNYAKMIAYHAETEADCTIAVLDVPVEEASRFGIMNTDENGRIYEFEEKPANPKSTSASMGVYVFNTDQLKKYLTLDENDKASNNDFGKNIIPLMLADDKKMMSYKFDGYWKDVGTIDSLWDSNMDLLNPKIPLNLDDPSWKIYTRTEGLPPHYIKTGSHVQNSLVSEGCYIAGKLEQAIISTGATIEKDAVVEDSIIMPGAVVKSGAVVQYAIVAENAVIGENAVVGARPEDYADKGNWSVATIGPNVKIGKGETVLPGEMIYS